LRNIPGPRVAFLEQDTTLSSLVLSIPVLIVSTLLLVRLLQPRSTYGRLLHWIRDDPLSAQAFAVPTQKLLTQVFCLHGVLSGLAGASIAISQAYISPQSFDLWLSLQVITVVYLSGTGGNPASMLAGAGALIALTELTRSLTMRTDVIGPLQQILISLLLVAVLAVRWRGLFGPIIEFGPSASRLE
jgi:branched-chain amino acid transport system permease protein